MTGIMDNPVTNGSEGKESLSKWLQQLREVSVETNEEWSDKLGIERSAITCVKPSGTVGSWSILPVVYMLAITHIIFGLFVQTTKTHSVSS